MQIYEFIKSLKTGKTTRKEWKKVFDAINRLKLNDEILDGIHFGLKKLSEREIKSILK